MAQQGGTCRDPSAVVKRLDSAASSSRQDQREKSDDEGWEVVAKPGNEQKSHGTGFSSSFDLQLGWGSWRTSVLSWDVNVRRGHTHLPSDSQASGNTAHEPKTEGKVTQSNSGGQQSMSSVDTGGYGSSSHFWHPPSGSAAEQ
ncbi:hypothetical protein CH063_15603 [Colletotrichum higginsianum]|uniref:Uncharacterized protein n=1 Tax=Colletotrichum higginsianum (strain IMI 349063) TaxID=759273 RepID=H1W3K0_COLHI|nr:hypothetical protein CH063_15603 [Colletotrichum higginsianum]